jgi:AGZA family xanthine/uracil permease-like MFS transporter
MLIGIFKLLMSFVGSKVQKVVPGAGLLGSLAGIGIALMGCLQLGDILAEPVVGFISLALIFYTLVARIQLPFKIPGVLASVAAGALVYYALGAAGLLVHPLTPPHLSLTIGAPVPTIGFVHGMPLALSRYLPMAIPFAILTVVGGINVTESARLAGDDYDTRSILMTEAVATIVAGVFGGVSQTTPYIGHPAYKAMGGRAAYTFATGLFVGLGGMLGYIPFMAMVLPIACLAPILVFVGFEIVGQSFEECPRAHSAAICLAMLPSIAQLLVIVMADVNPGLQAAALEPQRIIAEFHVSETFASQASVFVALAHGFILTAMLWGAALAFLIDRRALATVVTLVVAAPLALFGFIHSILPSGGVYLPWSAELAGSRVPWHWAGAYAATAILVLVLSRTTAFGVRQT